MWIHTEGCEHTLYACAIQHIMLSKIDTGGSQLIHLLVCQQHLTKSFEVAGMMPRLLHGLDVF